MPPSASTIERAVENETVFRRVNDEIEATASSSGATRATFVCECSDPNCGSTIEIPLRAYRVVRRNPTCFLVAAGHEADPDEFGRVVTYHLAYSVVQKIGYAAALATAAYERDAARGQ